jgi:hypothetical protein
LEPSADDHPVSDDQETDRDSESLENIRAEPESETSNIALSRPMISLKMDPDQKPLKK